MTLSKLEWVQLICTYLLQPCNNADYVIISDWPSTHLSMGLNLVQMGSQLTSKKVLKVAPLVRTIQVQHFLHIRFNSTGVCFWLSVPSGPFSGPGVEIFHDADGGNWNSLVTPPQLSWVKWSRRSRTSLILWFNLNLKLGCHDKLGWFEFVSAEAQI